MPNLSVLEAHYNPIIVWEAHYSERSDISTIYLQIKQLLFRDFKHWWQLISPWAIMG